MLWHGGGKMSRDTLLSAAAVATTMSHSAKIKWKWRGGAAEIEMPSGRISEGSNDFYIVGANVMQL